jgi:hypothetical protein
MRPLWQAHAAASARELVGECLGVTRLPLELRLHRECSLVFHHERKARVFASSNVQRIDGGPAFVSVSIVVGSLEKGQDVATV